MIRGMIKDFESMQNAKIIFKDNKYKDEFIKYVDILEMNEKYKNFVSIMLKQMIEKKIIDNNFYGIDSLLFSERVIDRLNGINICRKVLRVVYENI